MNPSEMRLDSPPGKERSTEGRFGGPLSFSARNPQPARRPEDAESRRRAAPACDFCRNTLLRDERHRLVWESPGLVTELILADLCRRCATCYTAGVGLRAPRQDTLRLVHEVRASAEAPKVVGFIARSAVYLAIGLAFFLIVTLISSQAHAG